MPWSLRRVLARVHAEAGLTLVELIISMVLMITVLTAVSTTFVSGTHAESSFSTRVQTQSDARLALTELRNDLHCSYAVQSVRQNPVSVGNPSGYGFTLSLTEFYNACAATVSSSAGSSKVFLAWCTLPSAANASVFNLFRAKGTCDATGQLVASDIVAPPTGWPQNTAATDSAGTGTPSSWNGNIFSTTPTCQLGYLQTLNVDLAVNRDVTHAPNQTYELKDQIALRNSTRCGTGTGALATVALSVSAAPGDFTGSPVTPSATVIGSSNETSPINFVVFGPQVSAPTDCSTGGTSVGTSSTSGDGAYPSSLSFTPSTAGNYWWFASMPADSNNVAVSSVCGSSMAKTTALVSKASPTLAMAAPGASAVGAAISAASIGATLASSSGITTGAISFTVFGPQATAPSPCTSGGTSLGTVLPSGDGTWNPSASYTPSTAGTYWWYASFAGDTYDNAATSKCGAGIGMASTVVAKASPTLVTAGPATGFVGTAIPASAISVAMASSSGAGANGVITFKVFGPQASAPVSCAAGTTVGTATPAGNGTYNPSAGYTPAGAGTYWWYASFAGDTNDNAATSACNGTMASTVVTVPDTFAITNPGLQTAGGAFNVTITAKLSGGATDTGYTGVQAITFTGPANGPNGTAPVYPATVAFSNGVGTASITLYKAASTTLTATQGLITGTSTAFTVKAAAQNKLQYVTTAAGTIDACPGGSRPGLGNGGSITVFVAVLDTYGNLTTNGASLLTITLARTPTSGGGNAPLPASLTVAGSANPAVTLASSLFKLPSGTPAATTYTATSGALASVSCIISK